MKNKRNKKSHLKEFLQRGQASRLILVLVIVILVAGIITFLILKMAEKPPAPVIEEEEKIPQPVYETTLNDIRFIFMGAVDRGNILKASQIMNPEKYYSKKDLTTTERFIIVTVGAQNKGKTNKEPRSWDIGNIVDSEGRQFEPLNDYEVAPWLPEENRCGELLKPEFDPLPCTKIYEISKVSTGLKITVMAGKKEKTVNPGNLEDNEYDFLDLIVK